MQMFLKASRGRLCQNTRFRLQNLQEILWIVQERFSSSLPHHYFIRLSTKFLNEILKSKILLQDKGLKMCWLIAIFSVLLKRLDDVHDEVRLEVLHSLPPLAASLPPSVGKTSPELESHFRSVYTTLLIHMDDQNHEIRAATMGIRALCSFFLPKISKELNQYLSIFRNTSIVERQVPEHSRGAHQRVC